MSRSWVGLGQPTRRCRSDKLLTNSHIRICRISLLLRSSPFSVEEQELMKLEDAFGAEEDQKVVADDDRLGNAMARGKPRFMPARAPCFLFQRNSCHWCFPPGFEWPASRVTCQALPEQRRAGPANELPRPHVLFTTATERCTAKCRSRQLSQRSCRRCCPATCQNDLAANLDDKPLDTPTKVPTHPSFAHIPRAKQPSRDTPAYWANSPCKTTGGACVSDRGRPAL